MGARGRVLTSEEERRCEIQWKRGFTGIPRSSLCINGTVDHARGSRNYSRTRKSEEDEEEREVAVGREKEKDRERHEGMARGMVWRRETVVGAVYTTTGETHFVHRSGIYRRLERGESASERVETRARVRLSATRTGGSRVGGRVDGG